MKTWHAEAIVVAAREPRKMRAPQRAVHIFHRLNPSCGRIKAAYRPSTPRPP